MSLGNRRKPSYFNRKLKATHLELKGEQTVRLELISTYDPPNVQRITGHKTL